MTAGIGRIGVWSLELRFGDRGTASAAAAELEALGYSALWVPGGIGGDITGDIDHLLDATSRATIATGILNIWKHDPVEIADWWKALPEDRRARVLLGLGVSHAHIVGEAYAKPLAVMRDYLDRLDHAGLPPEARCLAALGPKMLELAGARTRGVHPYLVTPAHTAIAREAVGPDRLVAPEQGVILETDPERARAIGRAALANYQSYPNYQNNWRRLGFTDAEIASASDRLIDTLFAWGDAEAIAARVNEHFTAGADHVCIQAITGAGLDVAPALDVLRELAPALH
ncbi:putative F420-dependent oxidoreductase [Novosphingobium sp. PhB165]|uniref:TIGR03620 family F420-dependent LLM class oxidoreductase n=1 Tax=Novosphingobium sp. PhB165 TaxID=2485105 RepID=UPI00104AA334|nr:TIGR03620 family F420-dependent LLM class oxidoreductase [Novosphingobium sp. PhB165]TCM20492.1 putative F420-dependent oxidoreductase [Novosphingobium sp. PhB165]